MQKYKWPLCADVFTFLDKIKIFKFLLTERIWTYGAWVRKFEKKWESYFGVNHVIMVSSGSTANELIALRRKWELQQSGEWPKKNRVIVPVNTWISSVSPWVHAGFDIVFMDVDPRNLNITSEILKKELCTDDSIGTVFYTALLGFYGDLEECKLITEIYGAKFLMDNCEATLSKYYDSSIGNRKNVMALATSSTSLFYSHFVTTGTEGGLIATNSQDEADWFRMMRSHGMTRGMDEKYKNPKVDSNFDFALLGSNYRSSNLQAYMGLLDFGRSIKFSINKRIEIFSEFYNHLDTSLNGKYEKFSALTSMDAEYSVPLAIPIICKTRDQRIKVETFLKAAGVATRPIIGGCLLEHTAFKGFGWSKDYPVAMNAHEKGLYIGLNKNITLKMARELAQDLNKL
jgi:CDP-6-deoxy-D-xylo-4-hexulose-3-dehydrase